MAGAKISTVADCVDQQKNRFTEFLTFLPVLFILSALFIDIAAGRWGSYIRTPISGLYLPDLLLIIGVLAALPRLREILKLPRLVLLSTALIVIYILFRLVEIFLDGGTEAPYLVLRDLAPFAYLALIPILAVALQHARFPWLLWTLRIASLLHVIGISLVRLGVLTPFETPLINPENTTIFDYRGDLQGVIFGIGILAWGAWPGTAKPQRLIQFLILMGVWQLGSRAALVTAVIAIVLAVIRERKYFSPIKFISLIVVSFVATIAINAGVAFVSALTDSEIQQNSNQTSSAAATPVESAANIESPTIKDASSVTPKGVNKLIGLEGAGSGTASARLATYAMVLDRLNDQLFWVMGAGPGTDILYEICTGESDGPEKTTAIAEDGIITLQPKCPVDDHDASSTLRDPHNWLLNLLIHHGFVGTLVFIFGVTALFISHKIVSNAWLPITAVALFFICGTFGVIISAPFAMLPIAVLLAWLVKTEVHTIQADVDARTLS